MFSNKKLFSQATKLTLRSSQIAMPKMGLFVVLKGTAARTQVMAKHQTRFFAAAYPDYMPLEMPNLSPTMEKVRLRHT